MEREGVEILEYKSNAQDFSYDLLPYSYEHGIEFEEVHGEGDFSVFYGSLSDFKTWAETVISKEYLQQRESLSDKIAVAQLKAEEKNEAILSKLKDNPEL